MFRLPGGIDHRQLLFLPGAAHPADHPAVPVLLVLDQRIRLPQPRKVLPAQRDRLRLELVVGRDLQQLPKRDLGIRHRVIVQQPAQIHRHIVVPGNRGQGEKRTLTPIVHRLQRPEDHHGSAEPLQQLRRRNRQHRRTGVPRIENGRTLFLNLPQIDHADPVSARKAQQRRAGIGFGERHQIGMRLRIKLKQRRQPDNPLDRILRVLRHDLRSADGIKINVTLRTCHQLAQTDHSAVLGYLQCKAPFSNRLRCRQCSGIDKTARSPPRRHPAPVHKIPVAEIQTVPAAGKEKPRHPRTPRKPRRFPPPSESRAAVQTLFPRESSPDRTVPVSTAAHSSGIPAPSYPQTGCRCASPDTGRPA